MGVKVLTQILCWLLIAGVITIGSAYAYMLGEILSGQGLLTALLVLLALPAGAIAVGIHRLVNRISERSSRDRPTG